MKSLSDLTRLVAGAIMAATCGLAMAQTTPAPRVLKAGIGLSADSPQGRGMMRFAELVSERTQGRILVELHPSGALGDDVAMTGKLQNGTQEISCPDSSTLARLVKDFSAINYPFTFLTEAEADTVLDGNVGRELLAALPAKGLIGLAFWENGFRHLTNSKQAVPNMTSASVNGIRMRVMQNQMLIDSFAELGFEPVPMAFPKVYAALADKQVDGQENPLPTILSSKFYQVQQHLTLSRHVYSAFVLLISKAAWDSLPKADQTVVAQAAREARDYQRTLNREMTAAALEQLKKHGMQVTRIEVRDAESARLRLRQVLEKYNQDIGGRFVFKMYLDLSRMRAVAPTTPARAP